MKQLWSCVNNLEGVSSSGWMCDCVPRVVGSSTFCLSLKNLKHSFKRYLVGIGVVNTLVDYCCLEVIDIVGWKMRNPGGMFWSRTNLLLQNSCLCSMGSSRLLRYRKKELCNRCYFFSKQSQGIWALLSIYEGTHVQEPIRRHKIDKMLKWE